MEGEQLRFVGVLGNGVDFLFPRPADACPRKNQNLTILKASANARNNTQH